MLEEQELIGAIAIVHEQVQPFTDKQMDLVMDFAAQTAVALVSARRERQYREVQMELALASRVAAIGQLFASIAHELKQPLAAVVINGDAILRWLGKQRPDIEEAKISVERIIREAHRASDIMSGLRDLTRRAAPRKEVVDLNGAILEVTVPNHSEAPTSGVMMRTQLAPPLPRVSCGRVQLKQVMRRSDIW
jgi:C4-dicarboxylate-specific signal transduction histidine kinase